MARPKTMLSVLLVTSDKYPPFRPAAKVIFGEEFAKKGHKVDWLIQKESPELALRTDSIGLGTAYLGATTAGHSRISRIYKHVLDVWHDLKMFSLMRSQRYDIIQVKDKYLSALFAIIAARIFHAKFAYWIAFPHGEASIHESREGIARYRWLYLIRGHFFKFLLYRIILPHADCIFVQSEQMRLDIAAHGISFDKMTAIPGSVSLENIPYQGDPVATVNGSAQPRVLYLGTFNRMRRLDFVIRAFSRVLEQVPNAQLLMLGKGDSPEDEHVLAEEIKRLKLAGFVQFTGFLPMAQAWSHIRDADVCLSPYFPTPILQSTSPTKLIEYMAMGKAVVGNDHPEQRLVIEQSGAGICTPWKEEDFSAAIVTILNDPQGALSMGQKGRRYVEKYRTNKVMAERVEQEYLAVCFPANQAQHSSVSG